MLNFKKGVLFAIEVDEDTTYQSYKEQLSSFDMLNKNLKFHYNFLALWFSCVFELIPDSPLVVRLKIYILKILGPVFLKQ